jgi:hypothetical protein
MKPCHFCGKYIDEYANDTRLLESGIGHRGRVACRPCLGLYSIKTRPIVKATLLDLYVIGAFIGLMSSGADRETAEDMAPVAAENLLKAVHKKEIENS